MIKKTLTVLALAGLSLGGLVACDIDNDYDRDCKRKNNTSQSLIIPEALDTRGGRGGGGGGSKGGGSKGGSSSKHKSGSSGSSNPVPFVNGGGSSGSKC